MRKIFVLSHVFMENENDFKTYTTLVSKVDTTAVWFLSLFLHSVEKEVTGIEVLSAKWILF